MSEPMEQVLDPKFQSEMQVLDPKFQSEMSGGGIEGLVASEKSDSMVVGNGYQREMRQDMEQHVNVGNEVGGILDAHVLNDKRDNQNGKESCLGLSENLG
jgi:hypothetical protein